MHETDWLGSMSFRAMLKQTFGTPDLALGSRPRKFCERKTIKVSWISSCSWHGSAFNLLQRPHKQILANE